MLSARDRGVPGTGWQVPETDAASSILPIHIEETIESIAGLNAAHHANATHHQRAVDRITSLLGRASFIATLTAFVVGWVSLNCFAFALGYPAPDPPPFACLAGASSLASLYLVVLILTTQRGDDRLTRRRELLNLELTILSKRSPRWSHCWRSFATIARTFTIGSTNWPK